MNYESKQFLRKSVSFSQEKKMSLFCDLTGFMSHQAQGQTKPNYHMTPLMNATVHS